MSVNITPKIIEAALRKGESVVLRDSICAGLTLNIGKRGATWSYRYRLRGLDHTGKRHEKKMVTLGSVTQLNPTEARTAAEQLKAQARDGIDPVAEAKAKKARERSLIQHSETYMATLPDTRHGESEGRNVKLAIREMNVGRAEDITVATVRDLVTMHRDKPAVAMHRLGALRRFLQTLVEDGVIASNPADGLAKRNKPAPPAPRSTVPTAAHVQALWNAEFQARHEVKSAYLRSMLLVPLRMGEMEALTTGDVKDGVLTVPGLVTKNGDEFRVPLSDQAREIFDARAKAADERQKLNPKDDGKLFPLATSGEPMNAWKRFREQVRTASKVEGFGFHDLRRLFLSEAVEHELGDMDIVDGLLNHRQAASRGGVKGHYLHAKRVARRKAVMQQWADLIDHAVEHGQWPREVEVAAEGDEAA